MYLPLLAFLTRVVADLTLSDAVLEQSIPARRTIRGETFNEPERYLGDQCGTGGCFSGSDRRKNASGKPNGAPVRVAYSALSAGIGVLWLTHEQGIFRKHGLESNLVYMRSGTTAAQALLAGEIEFGHLSPAPMMAAWAQGGDIAWVATTIHQMVFTLITDASITKAAGPQGKENRHYSDRVGKRSRPAHRVRNLGLAPKDVAVISMGGIPDILAGMKAGAVNGGILSPPTSTAARDLGYRRIGPHP